MVSLSPPQSYQQAIQNNKISIFVLGVWVSYLVLSPFYIFPKGQPQPADFILLSALGPVLITFFLNTKIQEIKLVYILGGLFVLTTMGVNFINYLFFPDPRLLLTMLYYPYNFLIFIFTAWLFQRDLPSAKRYTYYGLVATIIGQLLVIKFADFGYRGYRGTAGFENPNQLAYWTLLTAAMIVFLRRGEKLKLLDWVLLFLLLILQALALSKAGIIAHGVLMAFILITPKVSKAGYFLVLSLVILGIFYSMFNPHKLTGAVDNISTVQNVIKRIQGIGTEADDNPEARGYYRIIEHPFYTFFGSGEGAFYRFNDEGVNRELHSGIATMIFSYGVMGSMLFISFMTLLIYKQPWYYVLLFVPIILFGLPHQNFRFAHFWVLLGINYGIFLAQKKIKDKEK